MITLKKSVSKTDTFFKIFPTPNLMMPLAICDISNFLSNLFLSPPLVKRMRVWIFGACVYKADQLLRAPIKPIIQMTTGIIRKNISILAISCSEYAGIKFMGL